MCELMQVLSGWPFTDMVQPLHTCLHLSQEPCLNDRSQTPSLLPAIRAAGRYEHTTHHAVASIVWWFAARVRAVRAH